MTFKEIVDSCNRQLDQDFDNQMYIDWINECLDNITEDVFIPAKTIVNIVNGEFPLPTNFKSDLQVRVVGDPLFFTQVSYDDPVTPGYVFFGDTITVVNRTGVTQLEMLYSRRPSYITTAPDGVPDIPSQFHYVIGAFCRKKAMLQIEDIAADERFSFYANEYEVGKQKMKEYFTVRKATNSVPSTWKVVR